MRRFSSGDGRHESVIDTCQLRLNILHATACTLRSHATMGWGQGHKSKVKGFHRGECLVVASCSPPFPFASPISVQQDCHRRRRNL